LGFAFSDEGRQRPKVITLATEHKSVLEPLVGLARTGYDVNIMPVESDGLLDLEALEAALSVGDTGLVSVMAANNETGVIQDIETIARLSKNYGARFHTDATQLLGKADLPPSFEDFDYLSFSAHKIYGPKGVGALIARRGSPLEPLQLGGGQEAGRRSGTTNVPGVVGCAVALDIALQLLADGEAKRQARLVDDLVRTLQSELNDVFVVSGAARRISNTVNLRFHGADADAVLANTPGLCLSTGSACSERTPGPSHVLSAMRLGRGAEECIRFSIGRSTTPSDIHEAIERLLPAVRRVRELCS
jgi:cysteine desulfurase